MPFASSSARGSIPAIAGMPSPRARIAACDVALPEVVQKPSTRVRSSDARIGRREIFGDEDRIVRHLRRGRSVRVAADEQVQHAPTHIAQIGGAPGDHLALECQQPVRLRGVGLLPREGRARAPRTLRVGLVERARDRRATPDAREKSPLAPSRRRPRDASAPLQLRARLADRGGECASLIARDQSRAPRSPHRRGGIERRYRSRHLAMRDAAEHVVGARGAGRRRRRTPRVPPARALAPRSRSSPRAARRSPPRRRPHRLRARRRSLSHPRPPRAP